MMNDDLLVAPLFFRIGYVTFNRGCVNSARDKEPRTVKRMAEVTGGKLTGDEL